MHFTYVEPQGSDLQQGDVIRRTDEIDHILEEVHPHYFRSESYRFFVVVTQSCDLVRRNSQPPKSRYITIAAVRPIRVAIEREVVNLQYTDLEKRLGFCSADRKIKLQQFIERLLNNNEEDYFYLHRQPEVGLFEDHCAFLHLSITLKSILHYESLLNARILSLKDSFQHKLGYLVGTLYSRVGTEDWFTDAEYHKRFQVLCQEPLKDPNLVLWLEKDIYFKVTELLKSVSEPTQDHLANAVKEARGFRAQRKAEIFEIISDVYKTLGVSDDIVSKAKQRLDNRQDFTSKLRL